MRGQNNLLKYRKPTLKATLNGRTTLNGVQCVHIIVYSVEMGGRIQSIFFFALTASTIPNNVIC